MTMDAMPEVTHVIVLTFVRRRLGPGYRDVKVPEVIVFRSSGDTGGRVGHEALGLLRCVSGTGRWVRVGVAVESGGVQAVCEGDARCAAVSAGRSVTATDHGDADSLIRARRALTFRIRLGRDMLDGKVDERG
jgi:hypothetical protein